MRRKDNKENVESQVEISVEGNKFIAYDKENDQYTIAHLGKGGPIISGKTKDEAISKYEDAFKLSKAVQKLMYFKQTGQWMKE